MKRVPWQTDHKKTQAFNLLNPGNGIETLAILVLRLLRTPFNLLNPGNGIETRDFSSRNQMLPQPFNLLNPGNGIETNKKVNLETTIDKFCVLPRSYPDWKRSLGC